MPCSMPGPWHQNLSQNQESQAHLPEPPRHPKQSLLLNNSMSATNTFGKSLFGNSLQVWSVSLLSTVKLTLVYLRTFTNILTVRSKWYTLKFIAISDYNKCSTDVNWKVGKASIWITWEAYSYEDPDSAIPGWGLRFSISNNFPGNADVAGSSDHTLCGKNCFTNGWDSEEYSCLMVVSRG